MVNKVCSCIRMNGMYFFHLIKDVEKEKELGRELREIGMCCPNFPDIPFPTIHFSDTAEETLQNFLGLCAAMNAECIGVTDDSQRHFTKCCIGCDQFAEGECGTDGLIHFINFSMYPSLCQARCIYCDVLKESELMKKPEVAKQYEMMFEVVELASKCGIIAKNAVWEMASGEVAIHPYHDRLMSLIGNNNGKFFTNAMKFDEDVARNLHNNPNSMINFSIDSGTAKTWAKVKGIDNFDTAIENMLRYRANARPNQFEIKYILLPDLNDSPEDFISLIEFMKKMGSTRLTLSRDFRIECKNNPELAQQVLDDAALLTALLSKNGFSANLYTFSPEERSTIINIAKTILENHLI